MKSATNANVKMTNRKPAASHTLKVSYNKKQEPVITKAPKQNPRAGVNAAD